MNRRAADILGISAVVAGFLILDFPQILFSPLAALPLLLMAGSAIAVYFLTRFRRARINQRYEENRSEWKKERQSRLIMISGTLLLLAAAVGSFIVPRFSNTAIYWWTLFAVGALGGALLVWRVIDVTVRESKLDQ
jgi:hypothetical protein